uniref:Putative salivary lipocalin lipocalin n=1 Tax=Panstrongylus megistus TaxID=65343 RepID=A0A069DX15_9HEMI
MKTIIAVFFFGIVTSAFEQKSPEVDKCREETPATNLVSSQFFTGTWYVTHAKNISTSVCHEFSTKIGTDGVITVTADGYYDIGGKRNFYEVRCTGAEQSNRKVSLSCNPRKPSSTSRNPITVKVEVTIMETDNTKYALLYRCATSGPRKTDNYLVIQRDQNGGLPSLKSNVLSGQKGKVISRKSSTHVCGTMPPVQ